jgi:hypothetical protein
MRPTCNGPPGTLSQGALISFARLVAGLGWRDYFAPGGALISPVLSPDWFAATFVPVWLVVPLTAAWYSVVVDPLVR